MDLGERQPGRREQLAVRPAAVGEDLDRLAVVPVVNPRLRRYERVVIVSGIVSYLDLWWEDQTARRFFRRLASLGRLIMFDKRDTGLSDSAPGDLSLEQRIEDVMSVMGACGSSRAALFGYSEGGPMCVLFAATYPQRVSALILAEAAARWSPAPDYPCGAKSVEIFAAFERFAADGWGKGDSVEWYAPRRAGSARVRREMARWERMAASRDHRIAELAGPAEILVSATVKELSVTHS